MVKYLNKIRPESGFTHFLYIAINALLPLIILGFIRLDLFTAAIVMVFLAKWRMFAVKPRYWLINLRSNMVDILFGLSVVSFMAGSHNIITQAGWVIIYIGWLVWLKPKSKKIPVILQALLAQTLAITAYYQTFNLATTPLLVTVVVVWLICYVSARHFMGAFEESHVKQLANLWAWFGAGLAWILGHWVIFYFSIPQIALVLAVVSYGLAVLYFLSAKGTLKSGTKNQIIGVLAILLIIIIVISDWQYKTIQ